jgi:hypothetical protein
MWDRWQGEIAFFAIVRLLVAFACEASAFFRYRSFAPQQSGVQKSQIRWRFVIATMKCFRPQAQAPVDAMPYLDSSSELHAPWT